MYFLIFDSIQKIIIMKTISESKKMNWYASFMELKMTTDDHHPAPTFTPPELPKRVHVRRSISGKNNSSSALIKSIKKNRKALFFRHFKRVRDVNWREDSHHVTRETSEHEVLGVLRIWIHIFSYSSYNYDYVSLQVDTREFSFGFLIYVLKFILILSFSLFPNIFISCIPLPFIIISSANKIPNSYIYQKKTKYI